jgi:hypothetical protein
MYKKNLSFPWKKPIKDGKQWRKVDSFSIVLVVLLAAFLAACANLANEPANDTGEQMLDSERPQAETPLGILYPEQLPDAFVGAVNEQLFIAVTIAEFDQSGDKRHFRVYLCDSDQVSVWVNGEMAGDKVTLTDENTRVEVEFTEDHVTGTVVLPGNQPQPFTATPASGKAGLYRVEETFGETRVDGAWIVLNDGDQRGLVLHEDDEQQDITYLATLTWR